jgi:hypothetical protein
MPFPHLGSKSGLQGSFGGFMESGARGVFRFLGTAFGTAARYELSPNFERKYPTDKCYGEGDDSTAKEQESPCSKFVPELVPQEIDEIPS